jgi:hypothetical protein
MSVCPCSCLSYPASKSHHFCVALYCHMWSVWHYHIFILSHEGQDFWWGKKIDERETCVSVSLQLLSETFLNVRRTKRDIITNVQYMGLTVKCPLFLSGFCKTLISSTYQYNDRPTQLFTKYKYIWLWLQCFDPYLGHHQAYIMNLESVVHV